MTPTTADPEWALPLGSVHVLASEPYFLPPAFASTWGACRLLRHWDACLSLRPFLADGALVQPRRAVLRVAAVECEGLWRARQPCRGPIEGGVDVSSLNSLHSFAKVDAVQIWRHRHRLLSAPADALTIDFTAAHDDADANERAQTTRLQLTAAGTCHGLLLWIEYAPPDATAPDGGGTAGGKEPDEPWCASGPAADGRATPHFQGIRYSPQGVTLEAGGWVTCTARVDRAGGVLTAALDEPAT